MDSDNFDQIVSDHYESLYRFAFSLARAEADACDLTQQAFYVWAAKGHQLRDRSKVKTWLFTTLHRNFLESRRRQVRFPHTDLEQSESELPRVDFETGSRLDGLRAVQALARVDEIYQAAVALYYLEDYPYKDIAEILEIPLGTVKSRIARGLEQLRQIFQPDLRDPNSAAPDAGRTGLPG